MNNVVDLDSKRNKQTEDCGHEEVCPHCAMRQDWVATLLTRLSEIDSTDEAVEFAEEMYEWAKEDGARDAWETVAGFAIHHIEHIDDVEEEE